MSLPKFLVESLYSLFIALYTLGQWLLSHFAKKAKSRREIQAIEGERVSDNLVWFHVSSLGEYEMAAPLIGLFAEQTDMEVLLSFFSPSGYENIPDSPQIKYKEYLRLDTKANAKKWYRKYHPKICILVKYDIWYRHLCELHKHDAEIYLISADFSKTPWYFKPWAASLKIPEMFDYYFLQTSTGGDFLDARGLKNQDFLGDTRIERCLHVKKTAYRNETVENFIRDADNVIIWGSSWPRDEELLAEYIIHADETEKYILAPHEIGKHRMQSLQNTFQKHGVESTIYNGRDVSINKNSRLLLINSIGDLKYLYRYADFAHIGGGWHRAVHNIYEAIVYGIPVSCGPKCHNYPEIAELESKHILKVTKNASDLETFITESMEKKEQLRSGIQRHMNLHLGAAERIFDKIKTLSNG